MKSRIYLLITIGLLIGLHHAAAQNFLLSSTNTVVLNPPFVTAADVNGDGKVDLISVYSTSTNGYGLTSNQTNSLIVLTNNGYGVFVSNAVYSAGKFPQAVVAADVNGDGYLDLISADSAGTISVLTNNGSGVFGSNATYTVTGSPFSVAAADVNGDGYMDLVVANSAMFPKQYTLLLLTNNGSGVFGSNATYNVGSTLNFGPSSVLVADVNGDGWPDLISANPAKLTIFTNNGNGNFTFASSRSTLAPGSVIALDVNGNGNVQLIYVTPAGNVITVLTNNGSSIFNTAYTVGVGSMPYAIATADVNGDGKMDLITANVGASPNYVGTLTVLTNNGGGIFSSNANYTVGRGCQSVVTADVNGDGRLDLICANSGTNTLFVLTNTSTFLPMLAVNSASNNVIVSWASAWTGWAGWTLQQNYDLNSTNWIGFIGNIGDNGTTKSVTNSSPTGNLFFRLSHP
jgi:hypothetical protein